MFAGIAAAAEVSDFQLAMRLVHMVVQVGQSLHCCNAWLS